MEIPAPFCSLPFGGYWRKVGKPGGDAKRTEVVSFAVGWNRDLKSY